ncbi:XK-related protein 6-like [Stylophora pistillata]|nr:XK-related protein 6-like [Stylophora pistillata]
MVESMGAGSKMFCCKLIKRVTDRRPQITEVDPEAKFWQQRGQCSRFALVNPLFIALMFLVDVVMDCKMAATHYEGGDHKWAAYTLGVIIFSQVFTEILSAIFYHDDLTNEGKTSWLKHFKLRVKPWLCAIHLILCGRFLRCFQIFKTVRLIRRIDEPHEDNCQLYRLYISQLQDSSTLSVVEAFTEEAPQVALQMYILVQKSSLDWTSFANWFILVTIIKSLCLFSFNLLTFVRMLRLGKQDSQLLELFSFASLLHFTWRLSMVASRILALVLYASLYKAMIYAVLCVHLFFSYLLLRGQPNNYFEDGSVKDKFLRFAFTVVSVFCFFPLAGKRTRKWGGPYYLVTFIENSILLLVWYFYSDWKHFSRVMMLMAGWGLFLLGLLSLLLYYGIFHPSFKDQEDVGPCVIPSSTPKLTRQNVILQFESTV